jgi:hypothetical protein
VRLAWILLALSLSCCAGAGTVRTNAPPAGPVRETPASGPAQVEARLRQLRPRIAGLIARLGSTEYRVRREAQAALREVGLPAVPALEEAARSEDAEVSHAAAKLLETMLPSVPALIVSRSPESAAQRSLEKLLEAGLAPSLAPEARLTAVVKLLRSTTGLNILVQPGLQSAEVKVEPGRGVQPLAELLRSIAGSLKCAWVARFGALYLAEPAAALELAGAQVLSAEPGQGEELLSLMRERTVRVSLRKTELARALDFFTELTGSVASFAEEVSPETEVGEFEVSDITVEDALSLLFFSLGLKGSLAGGRLTISKGDYSAHSKDFRTRQSLLEQYRHAWKSPPPTSP